MSSHVPGALYAPLDRSFPTVAGSYVEPDQQLLMVADPHEIDTAVRLLVRIGLDRVVGYATAPDVAGIDRGRPHRRERRFVSAISVR